MENTSTYRATMHAGRCHTEKGRSTGLVFSSKHNDRNYDVEGADNINPNLGCKNLYYVADENGSIRPKTKSTTFESWELKMYNRFYGDWLEKQTRRHRAAGHEARVRTMQDVLKSARQAPREEVLSIGNFANQCPDEEAFIQVVHEYVAALCRAFPGVRVLDYAIHRDEEVKQSPADEQEGEAAHGEKSNIHAHLRMCFVHENEAGDFEPNQTQALIAMGINAPEPDEKISRFNNPIQTMSARCRELYVEIATRHGFQIETEPASPGKITLNKQEYLAVELKRENTALKAEREELHRENAAMARKNEELQSEVNTLKKEAKGLRALLRRWKRLFTPIKSLFDKLSKIHVSSYKTALDEVLLDANTAMSYDALKELEAIEFDEILV